MITRRTAVLVIPLVGSVKQVFPQAQVVSQTLTDGSIYLRGFVGGHRLESTFKVNANNETVARYEVVIYPVYAASVTDLIKEVGLRVRIGLKFSDPTLSGRPLIQQVDQVRADFHVRVNNVLFQDTSVAEKIVPKGAKLQIVAVANARLNS